MSTQQPQTHFSITHTWPWRGGEIRTIVAVVILGAAIGIWRQGPTQIALWTLGGLALAALLWHTKTSRVRRSAATLTTNGISASCKSPGLLGSSRVKLADIESIGYRRFGSDETLILAGGGSSLRLPYRFTGDPRVRDLLDQAVATATDIQPDARDLLDRIATTPTTSLDAA